jgi:hypothetical protein
MLLCVAFSMHMYFAVIIVVLSLESLIRLIKLIAFMLVC